jgi:hypothetical protein
MGSHQLTIHGHKVTCADDRANHGLKYLAYTMEEADVQALFEQAEAQKEVSFTDAEHRQFMLVDGENGTFVVVATNVSHGWF